LVTGRCSTPPGWTVVNAICDGLGWTARVADENGYPGTEILIFDEPPENPHHRLPG